MKEKIFRNLSLKILSALFAIIFWTIIVNIYDPSTGITMPNITVQLINEENLTDKGYTYEVVDGSKISVYVSGPKSIITDIKSSDIVATADLSEITTFADYVDIDVKVVKDGQVINTVEVTPRTTAVKLKIENRVTQHFDVGIDTSGDEAEGYVITRQSVTPSAIKITGSSTTLGKIAHVKAVCDINGAHSNIQSVVPISLYDAEGNVIDDPQIDVSKSEVEYFASVSPCKTIPIEYELSGEPALGYLVSDIELSAKEVTIAGTKDSLEKISSVVIPASELSVEGLTVDKVFRKWLSQYLPADVYVVSDNVITVGVKIANINSREFTIPAANIAVNGLQQGLKAQISDKESIDFKIYSTGSTDVSGISIGDIKVSLNLSGLSAGSHSVELQFELPQNFKLLEQVYIPVKIEAQQPSETNTEAVSGSEAASSSSTSNNR